MRQLWWFLLLLAVALGLLLGLLSGAAPVRPSEDVNYLNLQYAREIHQAWLGYGSPHPLWDADWVVAYTALLEGTDDAPNIREKWDAGYYKDEE